MGVEASNENGGEAAGQAVRAKSPRKKTSKSPPPVPPKPSGGSEEGVVEETISAGEAIIKFETESATFAAVSGQETATANCKKSKGEGKSKTSKESDIKSRKKTDSSQGDNQEKGIEEATTENAAGTAAVNGKTSRSSRTSEGSKTRSVSVSSSRKSAKGSTSGVAESSKEGVDETHKELASPPWGNSSRRKSSTSSANLKWN